MDNRENKVQVSHLTKQFGDLLVLNDISFNVKKGEFLCIVGPTGCGKTTFLNSLTKLYQPTKGEILINGEVVDLKKHNIAYIFQEYSTMPWLTVEENVRFGLDIKHIDRSISRWSNQVPQILSRPVICQHAAARGNRQSLRHRTRSTSDGRTIWSIRH